MAVNPKNSIQFYDSPDQVTVTNKQNTIPTQHERQLGISKDSRSGQIVITAHSETPIHIEKNHQYHVLNKGQSMLMNDSDTVYIVKEVPNVKVTTVQKVVTKTITNAGPMDSWNSGPKQTDNHTNQLSTTQSVVPKSLTSNKNEDEGRYSLAFPSISTAAYKFDIDRASTVGTKVIKNFLDEHKDPEIKLYLVDLGESETLTKFRKKAEEIGLLKDPRFHIQSANIVGLKDANIPCWYIVNASNPGFKSSGSGTNKAIHKASEGHCKDLRQLTLAKYTPPAVVGDAYPVDLVPGSPLRDVQNVRVVIHVVGPNMSMKRENNLRGDYDKGERLLAKAYSGILDCFYDRTGLGTQRSSLH